MKRFIRNFTIILFIVLSGLLTFIAITKKNKPIIHEDERIYARIVKPITSTANAENEKEIEQEFENDHPVSLVKLHTDETLLGAQSVDINNDSMDDQIIAVKKAGTSSIYLITGIYNPRIKDYERVSEINTRISQSKTFSFSINDITGTHENTLIFSGINDRNESVLRAFLPDFTNKDFTYNTIADFSADGAVFLQQIERNDTYSFLQTNGESFPIWVYSTDSSKGKERLDQIQIMYNWSPITQKYEKISETRVTGKKTTTAELRLLQDGSIDTFKNYLSGLWYKSSGNDNTLRYIFFNPTDEEIIFAENTTQEVYIWTTSTPRKNGIYLTSKNKSISNLVRRFDIALNGKDEIKIKVNDDVKMVIGQETLWDGTYKKTTLKSFNSKKDEETESTLTKIESNFQPWNITGNKLVNIQDNKFKISSKTNTSTGTNTEDISTGIIASTNIAGTELLQFRTNTGTTIFSGYYLPTIETDIIQNIKQESLLLTQVSVSTSGFTPTGSQIVLTRTIEIQ